jgi:hypothetical protein
VEELSPKLKNGELTQSINRCALDNALVSQDDEWAGVMQPAHGNLFSNVTITITPTQLAQMQAVIAAVEKVVAMPAWHRQVLGDASGQFVPANMGVFFGYDFHLNEDGAHLIEINTNAGGAFFNILLQQSQRDDVLPGKSPAADDLEQAIVAMFRHEWQLQRSDEPLRTIAIVDEVPQSQYFYPEFVLARQMFERAGFRAFIADPADFEVRTDGLYCGESKVDLIYNRLTDFSLAQHPVLLAAYQQNQLVLTPHPHAYTLYADKRNLTLFTDGERLRAMGVDDATIATLLAGIPQTRVVEAQDSDHWWRERKEWFFKPATGYGGKGSYRGANVTQRVFAEIMQGGYVAQRRALPGERMVSVAGAEPAAFKFDVRCYVYDGVVQLVIARLYQGQMTNFRTPGGGFGMVRVAGGFGN